MAAIPLPITLNGLTVLSARITIPWRGVWTADLTIDTSTIPAVQTSGPAILVCGGSVLTGTIDPRGSGTFLGLASLRIVGGRGGWDKGIPAQHFQNPAGALAAGLVRVTSGGLVGELVTDTSAEVFGEHYLRSNGPASRVLDGEDWHVDPVTGTTLTAPWLPAILDPDAIVNDYDIIQHRVTIFSDTLVLPGTRLIDERFNGQVPVARDVIHTFDSKSRMAEVWVSPEPTSRLADALANMVTEFGGTTYLRHYRYRFVLPAGAAKMTLQSEDPSAPDLAPIEQWSGVSGVQTVMTPGSEVIVGFTNGDPSKPYVAAYSPLGIPIEIDLTAATLVKITSPAVTLTGAVTAGAIGAPSIVVAGGTRPLAAGPPIIAALNAIGVALTAISAATVPPTSAAAATANVAIAAAASEPPIAILG